MSKINAPKGTVDLLPAESWKWQAVEAIARTTAELFNFREVRTPLFEHTELFHRGVGETSDIVHKETYTFTDRGGRSLTLRPEQTAGVVRAMIENGVLNDEGARSKVYYIGPNFRYENVQKGRLRQHHQFGVEAFGVPTPEQDVECILLQLEFYKRAGIKELALRVNSLGDRESKQRYREALVAFLKPKVEHLSHDSKRRLDENPLRILDSKDPADINAVEGAPAAKSCLSEKSLAHFDRVTTMLTDAAIRFAIDGTLVRGFDYYTDTLWEVTAGGLGSQNALGGGGRYDNLVEQLGGRPTPGVGFGSGLERLLLALDGQNVALTDLSKPLIWLAYHGDAARAECMKLATELRAQNFRVDMDITVKSIKAQFKLADRERAVYCIILGEDELKTGRAMLKSLKSAAQSTIERAALINHLRSLNT